MAAVVFGAHVLVFRSGSMAPSAHTGDVALARTVSATELRPGDVVSVLNATGDRVTHRVVDVAGQGHLRRLTLKGDANDAPDREVYTLSEAQRVLFVVPKAGFVVAWGTGPIGLMALGGYTVFLLWVLLRRGERDDHNSPSPACWALPVALILVAGAAAATGLPARAWAAPWTDAAPVGGTTLQSATVPAPANFSCGLIGVASVTFTWTAVPGATDYILHYEAGGAQTATTTNTSMTITTLISQGTAWVVANHNFGVTTWSSGASNTRTYTVAAASLCS